jgi:hypothetical protein
VRISVFSSGVHGPDSQPRPANSTLPFIAVIVEAPVLQIIAMVMGFFMLMLEVPAPFLKGTAIHRSLILRVVGLLFQTFICILYYQVRRLPCAFAGDAADAHTGDERSDILVHRGDGICPSDVTG